MKLKLTLIALLLSATAYGQFRGSNGVPFSYTSTLSDSNLFVIAVPGVTNKNITWGNVRRLATNGIVSGTFNYNSLSNEPLQTVDLGEVFGEWSYAGTLFSKSYTVGASDYCNLRCAFPMQFNGGWYVYYAANNTCDGSNVGVIGLYRGASLYSLTNYGTVINTNGRYAAHIQGPSVFDGDYLRTGWLYMAAFGGTNTSGPFGFENPPSDIFLFKSTNGINWTVCNSGYPILPYNASEWNSHTQWSPTWVKNKGLYYLYYNASSTNTPFIETIGFATATHPEGPWTEYTNNPVMHGGVMMLADPSILPAKNGQWVMNFNSTTHSATKLWFATSQNLTNWVIRTNCVALNGNQTRGLQGPEFFLDDGPAFLADDTVNVYLFRPNQTPRPTQFQNRQTKTVELLSTRAALTQVRANSLGITAYTAPTNRIPCFIDLDADNAQVTPGASFVDLWLDASGNARYATNANGEAPWIFTNRINGLPSVKFHATSYLETQTNVIRSNITMFAVMARDWNVKRFTPIVSMGYTYSNGIAFTAAGNAFEDWPTNAFIAIGNGYASTNNPRAITSPLSLTNGQFVIITAQLNASQARVWLNGTAISTNEVTAPVPEVTATLQIGRATYTTDQSDAEYNRIIVTTNVITEADRQWIEGLLAHKCGLVDMLPSTHPYKQTFGLDFASLTGGNTFTGGTNAFNAISSTNFIGDGAGITNIPRHYACLTIATGAVATAGSEGPNVITNWSYRLTAGAIGIVTNALWLTNAGTYEISYGTSIVSGGSDTAAVLIYTNGVEWPHIRLNTTFGGSPVAETGFKDIIAELPANTVISMVTTNSSTTAQTLNNTVLNIKLLK